MEKIIQIINLVKTPITILLTAITIFVFMYYFGVSERLVTLIYLEQENAKIERQQMKQNINNISILIEGTLLPRLSKNFKKKKTGK